VTSRLSEYRRHEYIPKLFPPTLLPNRFCLTAEVEGVELELLVLLEAMRGQRHLVLVGVSVAAAAAVHLHNQNVHGRLFAAGMVLVPAAQQKNYCDFSWA
jgi:hypothetical protein